MTAVSYVICESSALYTTWEHAAYFLLQVSVIEGCETEASVLRETQPRSGPPVPLASAALGEIPLRALLSHPFQTDRPTLQQR